jgi:acetyl esterase/lipase
MRTDSRLSRRYLLLATLATALPSNLGAVEAEVTWPVVSETACPLETITPIASDGYRGLGVLRKPPGNGPFPAIISVHGGIWAEPLSNLEAYARAVTLSRFLAAGYVIVAPTYRSRDVDPQSPVSLEDSLAVVDYVRKLPYVDAESIVVFGCSGGGDLALEVAARTNISVAVAEEPASMLMAGMFHSGSPKSGDRYTPADSVYLMENPKRYYTPEFQKTLRDKIARIGSPILIVQGDVNRWPPINGFNAEILIPELHAAGKAVTVKSYSEQLHCFCQRSGLEIRSVAARPSPGSWPRAALEAFRDMDAFCRPYLKTQPGQIESSLVTYAAVRQ